MFHNNDHLDGFAFGVLTLIWNLYFFPGFGSGGVGRVWKTVVCCRFSPRILVPSFENFLCCCGKDLGAGEEGLFPVPAGVFFVTIGICLPDVLVDYRGC